MKPVPGPSQAPARRLFLPARDGCNQQTPDQYVATSSKNPRPIPPTNSDHERIVSVANFSTLITPSSRSLDLAWSDDG